MSANNTNVNQRAPNSLSKQLFGTLYSTMMFPVELIMKPVRKRTVGKLEGSVLEVGCGPGPNFGYYNLAKAAVFAIEPNDVLCDKARAESQRTAASTAKDSSTNSSIMPVTVLHAGVGDSEALAAHLPPQGVDHIVFFLVLCSIPDARRAVEDCMKFLKVGGQIHIVEHVRNTNSVIGFVQDLLQPLWGIVTDGCHLNRCTEALFSRYCNKDDSRSTSAHEPRLMLMKGTDKGLLPLFPMMFRTYTRTA